MRASQPVADASAARALGASLRRVGYTEDAVVDLLGEDAFGSDLDLVPLFERRLPETRLATAIRLFFLEQPVAREEAVRALGERAVDGLGATALADVGRDVVPRARISPVAELLIASDGLSRDPGNEPADHVSTYTPASKLCDFLTPRPRVARALDVGTGPGMHALLAARHSDHVVATDVNPRALAFTRINAALNGLRNVECRLGGLYEPVDGEQFDLITCNAPYVISPEQRWTYRDSGHRGDAFSERVVRGALPHLADGGYATLIVSWLAHDPDEPDEHPLDWIDGSGCDAWIVGIYGADPLDHASEWNSHLRGDDAAFGDALDRWSRELAELDARWVTEGGVLLHKRVARRHSVRADEVDPDTLDVADEQIRRAFAARARLAALARRHDALELRPALAMPVEVRAELEPRRGREPRQTVRVELLEGTRSLVDAPLEARDVLQSLDGRTPLRDAAARAGASERAAVRLCRELLELGALELR